MNATSKLAALLAPSNPDDFFRSFHARKHLYITRKPGTCGAVLNLQDLDTLFQSQRLPAIMFEVVKSGVKIQVEDWSRLEGPPQRPERIALTERLLALYGGGATLIVNGIDHLVPGLGLLCRQLSSELKFPVRANVYITPPGAQGFERHADDHEVLVLQIHGRKSWRIFPEFDGVCPLEMSDGDLLYIPRGLIHEAESRDSASVHITLGLTPVYGYQLIEELAKAAKTHPAFRNPVDWESSMASGGAPETELLRCLKELLGETPMAELRDRRFGQLLRSFEAARQGRLYDVIEVHNLSLDSIVRLRKDVTVITSLVEKSIQITFSDKTLFVPLFMEGILKQFLAGEDVAIRDLNGLLSDDGRVKLTREFVQAGFLQIVS